LGLPYGSLPPGFNPFILIDPARAFGATPHKEKKIIGGISDLGKVLRGPYGAKNKKKLEEK